MRLVLAALVLAVLPSGPAVAAGSCDELVIDQTGLVDVAEVRRAALDVQGHAAEIRVRVYASVPGGDLDAQERADRAECLTWRKPNGKRRDNLIVMSVSIEDRKVGLYYGTAWNRDLRRRWTAIQSQAMSPEFKAGRWTEGLVGGLWATARAIDPMRNPSGADDGAPPFPVMGGPDDVGGGSGEGIFALFAIAALVIGGLSFMGRLGGGGSRFRSGATTGFVAGSLWGSGRGGSNDDSFGGGGIDGGGHGAVTVAGTVAGAVTEAVAAVAEAPPASEVQHR